MSNKPRLIDGGIFEDSRGSLEFNNNLEFFDFKRFYIISSPETPYKRAWRGHKREGKLFTVLEGSFEVKLIVPENWEEPKKILREYNYTMSDNEKQTLLIPGGHYIGFINKEPHSKMLVHSNFSLEESKNDDYLLEAKLWNI